jgi:two-component system sensor histidine kinase BarA
MLRGISLANKCQLLFGLAVLLILTAVLSVPWVRSRQQGIEHEFEIAREHADAWLASKVHLGSVDRQLMPVRRFDSLFEDPTGEPLWIALIDAGEVMPQDERDPFVATALRRFQDDADVNEHTNVVEVSGTPVYRYARAVRQSHLAQVRDPSVVEFSQGAATLDPSVADPVRAVLVIDRKSRFAEGQMLLTRVYLITVGLFAWLLAMAVFYFILTKLIFSPVRKLKSTAETVQKGDLTVRSTVSTGDEFQELAEAFNSMLDRVVESQAQLRSMNQTLDLKLTELSEANIGLYESNRLKGEFLANISHELRTPLNSIIGFTELLQELAQTDPGADPKRLRYLDNILTSGRSLLEMINELLEMAKIEAGRMEVNVEPTSVSDLVEGLVTIMRPQAQGRRILLTTELSSNLPMVETDPGKLQQILFNFLSNAIKFTPAGGSITLTADRVTRQDKSAGVRLGVRDTGPGIPYDMQDMIFEKFRQLDASHTREHPGTGLGLAICRELAEMLGGSVSLVSEPGRGATFYVELPMTHQPREPLPLMG